MNGPNNLLGHLALEKMWPEQYKALRDMTEVPVITSTKKVPVVVSNAKVTVSSSRGSPVWHVPEPQTRLQRPHAPDPGVYPATR